MIEVMAIIAGVAGALARYLMLRYHEKLTREALNAEQSLIAMQREIYETTKRDFAAFLNWERKF